MKKMLIYSWSLLLLLGGAVFLAGCDDDDDNNNNLPPEAEVLNVISDDNIKVPAEGKTVVIDIESNVNYTFEMSEWVEVADVPAAEKSAYCAAHSKISLKIEANRGAARTCDVVIKSGDSVKKTIRIEQEAAALKNLTIDIDDCKDDTLKVMATGGKLHVIVKEGINYECELNEWTKWELKTAAVDEAAKNELTINIMPNLEGNRRTTLNFKWQENGEDKSREVVICQEAIVFSLDVINPIPYAGGDGQVKVSAVGGDDPESTVTLMDIQGEGLSFEGLVDSKIGFGVLKVNRLIPNYRDGEVSIQVIARFKYWNNEPVIKVFRVTQQACPAIAIEAEDAVKGMVELGTAAGTKEYAVKVPFEGAAWDAKIYTIQQSSTGQGTEEVECTWATLEKTATGIKVDYTENILNMEKKATVKVFLKDDPQNYATIDFIQQKAEVAFVLTANNQKVKYSATNYELMVNFEPKAYYCVAEMVNDGGFLTLTSQSIRRSPLEVIKDATLSVVLDFNENTAADERVAILKISLYDEEGGQLLEAKEITFTQEGKPALTPITLDKTEITITTGRPVQLGIEGAEEVEFYDQNGSVARYITVASHSSGSYFLQYSGQGAMSGRPNKTYVLPKGTAFQESMTSEYASLMVTCE